MENLQFQRKKMSVLIVQGINTQARVHNWLRTFCCYILFKEYFYKWVKSIIFCLIINTCCYLCAIVDLKPRIYRQVNLDMIQIQKSTVLGISHPVNFFISIRNCYWRDFQLKYPFLNEKTYVKLSTVNLYNCFLGAWSGVEDFQLCGYSI